nr:MAG TPA: hypothetical protein [Caudoviricetes sp.]
MDHTPQSEQAAARHALEDLRNGIFMADEGIWSAAVK